MRLPPADESAQMTSQDKQDVLRRAADAAREQLLELSAQMVAEGYTPQQVVKLLAQGEAQVKRAAAKQRKQVERFLAPGHPGLFRVA